MLRFVAIACLVFSIVPTTITAGNPKADDAADLLAAALKKAKNDNKAVFLSFGAPMIEWCEYLDKFNARPEVTKILKDHLDFVKVDIANTPGGADLFQKFAPEDSGLPFWVIISGEGKVLADAFDENKMNVGFPYEPDEIKHYQKAIKKAVPKLTEKEVETLVAELKKTAPKKD